MADDANILPTIREVIGPAKDAIAEALPAAAPHLDRAGSMYSKVLTGWRGQFTRANARLAAESVAARLGLATGAELTETARSNYDTERNADPIKAVGEVILARRVIHVRPDVNIIVTADAADGLSSNNLIIAIAVAMNAHLLTVYSSGTGLGAHQLSDVSGTFVPGALANMGDMVTTTRLFLTEFNRHLLNERISDGQSLAIHPDADSDHVVTLAKNPFSSASGSSFAANSKAAQQSLLVALNTLKRAVNTHFALEAPGGTVRKGTRVSVAADATTVPPMLAATYEIVSDVIVRAGAGSAANLGSVLAKLEATSAGTSSNQPFFSDHSPTVTVQASLFDAAQTYHLEPITLRAAGGSAGQSDVLLRAASGATWRGTLAPTMDALLAGSLRTAGVAHFAEIDSPLTGRAHVYVSDETWAQSFAWLDRIEQVLRADWLGTGQRIGMGTIINQVVRVRVTVVLRDSKYLADTDPTTAAIKSAITSYFDDRQDWFMWQLASLRGRVVASDRLRILKVTSVAVLDGDGVPIAEPATPDAGGLLTHWLFADNALDVTYDAPN